MGSQTSKDGGSGLADYDPCSAPYREGNAFKIAMRHIASRNGVTLGGSLQEGYFGGREFDSDPARSLREYESSLSARAKEDVIRRLARALKRAGVEVDPEGDADTIVAALVAQIPNPKNGKTFANDAKAHNKVCSVIADVLNDEFTPGATKASEKFIDTSVGAVEMCRSVGEWAHSFAAGVNVEFLAVHASVKNSLRAIQILDEVMAKAYATITTNIDGAKNSKLSRAVEPLNVLYKRAQNERRKQEELLKNILNVQLAPAAAALELAMRDESEQNALVKKLGLQLGTVEFGDSLAMAISGLGTAASIAQRVHKALKVVGTSISQYLESSEFADFRKMVDEKLENHKIPFEELADFIEAVDELGRAFSHRKESRFRAALEEAGKTGGKRGGKGLDDSDSDEYSDDEDDSSAVKRAKNQRREKKIILHDFAKRMSRNYDEMLSAVKAMGPKLGKEIPLSDRMDVLRDALARLSELRKDAVRLELSLVGYYIDADARMLKEEFVNALRFISSACMAVMGLEIYRTSTPEFARLKAAIDGIEKTVDFFADVFANKYGRYGVGGEADDAAVGGGDDDLLPNISRNAISLTEAVNEFAYFYYVAKVRTNLDQTAAEIDSYSENYVELLGHAVAARIYNLETERNRHLAKFSDHARSDHTGGNDHGHANHFGPTKAANQPLNEATKMSNTMQWIREEYATKIRFYKAIQAIDLYMKAFTAGIVKDPDAVRDIKKMLDGTQANARWFNENTGDCIWKAFECMGASYDAPGTNAPKVRSPLGVAIDGANIQTKTTPAHEVGLEYHYYEKLSALSTNGNAIGTIAPSTTVDIADTSLNVGVPVFGASIDTKTSPGLKARKHISEAIDHFQALKNIINAFARIGDKFGGRELRAQVFMSPTQIYKTLVEYLKVSALSIYKTAHTVAHEVPPNLATSDALPGVTTGATTDALKTYHVFFGTINVDPEEFKGNFRVEDRFFALAVKAMAAKLLTTLGVYDMFERTTPIYDLTPTRIIVGGGGGESDVEVLDGAAELYFRLPRLAEFYHMMRWDGETDQFRIALLPELEGVFSELIRLIFLKEKIEDSNVYSDNDLRVMIREINSIYTYFRDKHDSSQACQEAILAFVVEINRRYGVIKGTDMKKYWKMVNMARTGRSSRLNDTDYEILPGEDDTEVERRAPSDRYAVEDVQYQTGTLKVINPLTGSVRDEYAAVGRRGAALPEDWTQPTTTRSMLRRFRDQFEKAFTKVSRADFRKVSYSLLIRQAQGEIKRAASADKKIEVAFKLIKGTNLTTTDASKGYMFHETVVLGLNSLCAVEALLRQFNDKISSMNPQNIENEIMDRIYARYLVATEAAGGDDGTDADHYRDNEMGALFNTSYDPIAGPGNHSLKDYVSKPNQYNLYKRYLTGQDANHFRRSGLSADSTQAEFRTVMALVMAEAPPNQAQIQAMAADPVNPDLYVSYLLPCPPSSYNDTVNPQRDETMKSTGSIGNTVNLTWSDERIRLIKTLRLFARFTVNYKLIMCDYVENLFALMGGMPIGQTGQRLVDVKFIPGSTDAAYDGSIQVGFSKLRDVSETVLSEAKAYIDKFRPYIPKEVLNRFENVTSPGSVHWIEKHLVDAFFKGSFSGSTADRRLAATNTLDGISRKTADILRQLGRLTHVSTKDLANMPTAIAALAIFNGHIMGARQLLEGGGGNNPHESRREEFGQALSALIFYDSVDTDAGFLGDFKAWQPDIAAAAGPSYSVTYVAAAGGNTTGNASEGYAGIGELIALSTASGVAGGRVKIQNAAGAELSRLRLYGDDSTEYRSLLFAFNQFMAQYLSTLKYVENGPRFYTNLINTFVNGAWASAVDTPPGNTWPDLVNATEPRDAHIGIRGDPRAQCILFQSLAYILQRIKSDTVSPQLNLPRHLVATLSEVPLHAKESYRANLPGFIKLFGILHEKCLFIKQLMENKCISCARPSQLYNGAAAIAANTRLFTNNRDPATETLPAYQANSLNGLEELDGAVVRSTDMKNRLCKIVDQLTYAANTMRNAASEVLKELGDSPVYFETQEGSIEAYRVAFGVPPLMPLSLAAWFLKDLTLTAAAPAAPAALTGQFSIDTMLYPKFPMGATGFKLQYGVRQLLARSSAVSYEQIPSVKMSLDDYNSGCLPNETIDEKKNLDYVNAITTLLRFAVDCRNYKPMLASTNYIFSTNDVRGVLGGLDGIVASNNHEETTAVWPLYTTTGATDEAILQIVEGSSQDTSVSKITERVSGVSRNSNSRNDQRIYNLIDMNIIPINVHALMRDIPLANLYNYEFTFEQMVASMFGEQTSQFDTADWAEGGLSDNSTANTRQMMLRFLNNPYIKVSDEMYGTGSKAFVHRIFRGDNNLGMGRPKFLSDQLFNKALFGSTYERDAAGDNYDEAGPAVGAGHFRGANMEILRRLREGAAAVADINAIMTTGLTTVLQRGTSTAIRDILAHATVVSGAATTANTFVDGIMTRIEASTLGAAVALITDGAVGGGNGTTDQGALIQEIRDYYDNNTAKIQNLAQKAENILRGAIRDLIRRSGAAVDAAVNDLNTAFNNLVTRSGAAYLRPAAAGGGNPAQFLGAVDALVIATDNDVARVRGRIRIGSAAGAVIANLDNSPSLTFLGLRAPTQAPETVIKAVSFNNIENKHRLQAIGKLRFDTYFVRKLFFITNVARILRLKLNRELTQSRSVLPTSHMSVTPGITEYDLDPFAPNEVYASHIGDGYDYDPTTRTETDLRRGMTRFADGMQGI